MKAIGCGGLAPLILNLVKDGGEWSDVDISLSYSSHVKYKLLTISISDGKHAVRI
jgi:hypothetical protein